MVRFHWLAERRKTYHSREACHFFQDEREHRAVITFQDNGMRNSIWSLATCLILFCVPSVGQPPAQWSRPCGTPA